VYQRWSVDLGVPGGWRSVFVLGALVRREFRRGLQLYGLDYSEDKGLIDSQFVVTGEEDRLARFKAAFNDWSARIDSAGKKA
jgi:hypothetical protein